MNEEHEYEVLREFSTLVQNNIKDLTLRQTKIVITLILKKKYILLYTYVIKFIIGIQD